MRFAPKSVATRHVAVLSTASVREASWGCGVDGSTGKSTTQRGTAGGSPPTTSTFRPLGLRALLRARSFGTAIWSLSTARLSSIRNFAAKRRKGFVVPDVISSNFRSPSSQLRDGGDCSLLSAFYAVRKHRVNEARGQDHATGQCFHTDQAHRGDDGSTTRLGTCV